MISIRANIVISKKSQKGIILGEKGRSIKKLTEKSIDGVKKYFKKKEVDLKIWVKIKKDWFNSSILLDTLIFKE